MSSPEVDVDPLVQEALKLIEDGGLRSHLLSALPNDGQNLKDICQVGFAQYEKNVDKLAEFLRDE